MGARSKLSWGSAVEQVTNFRPKERVAVDSERLSALYSELGHNAAEDVVCRAMEELALRLSHCDRLYRAAELDKLRKSSRSLIAIAEQIGMAELAQVAEYVTRCIDARDDVALAATLARLMRIGEGSLSAMWDLQDITI